MEHALQQQQQSVKMDYEIAMQNFLESIKAQFTRRNYSYALDKFLKFLDLKEEQKRFELSLLLTKESKEIEKIVISFILKLRKEGYSYGTIMAWINGIMNFFIMNDIVLNKKKITRFMGEHIKTVKDRGYTIEEIKKILDCCNLKFKVVVTLMVSTGCRVGSIATLKFKDLKYIESEKLYKIIFYTNTKEEYYSFTTSECSKYINEYLEYRKRCGENIMMESPLIRNDFQQDDILQAEHPKPQTTYNFEFYIRSALIRAGIRTPIKQNFRGAQKKNRKLVSTNHGFRKFVITTMVNKKIQPEIREMLVGHSIGLASVYYKPTEDEMLSEYLKVVDDLTINDENRLKRENEELKGEDEYKEYFIQQQLRKKDSEIEKMQQQLERLTNETSRNRQEFLDIARKIKEIKEAKKIDPVTRQKIKAGIISKEEQFDSWLQYSNRREQTRDEIEEWIEQKSSMQQEEHDFFEKNIRPTLQKYQPVTVD